MMALLWAQSSWAEPPYYHRFLRSSEMLAIPKAPSKETTVEDGEGGNAEEEKNLTYFTVA